MSNRTSHISRNNPFCGDCGTLLSPSTPHGHGLTENLGIVFRSLLGLVSR